MNNVSPQKSNIHTKNVGLSKVSAFNSTLFLSVSPVGFQPGLVPWKIPRSPAIYKPPQDAALRLLCLGRFSTSTSLGKLSTGRLSDIATENTTWAFKRWWFRKENLLFQRNPGWLTHYILARSIQWDSPHLPVPYLFGTSGLITVPDMLAEIYDIGNWNMRGI